MKPNIQPLKGTRDFYPTEMAVRTWLYNQIRTVSESYGYQEYEGPFLESLELYAARSGEELVKEQAFVFPDRSGDLITLRPELTPTLARMIAQRQRQLTFPARWWSFGPFWRYERPQKGRTREFFQWNIDLLGVDSPETDAELVAVACSFFRQVGLTPGQVQILVNNRKLMDGQLAGMGIPPDQRPAVLRLVDRRDKMTHAEWEAYAAEVGLSLEQTRQLTRLLENLDLWKGFPDLERFFEAIDVLGVAEYVRFAPSIIRGLDYYTGTVFEAWDQAGEFRAMFGGGRYDNLVNAVGGEPLPATGFAMGDVVITLILNRFGLLPKELGFSPAKVLVTVFDEGSLLASFALAARLREAGLPVVAYPEAVKITRQFKYADRMGMLLAVVLGPEEQARGEVAVKELASGEQTTIRQEQAAAFIRELLLRRKAI